MTKISLAEWNENKTIQQNAEHFGVCYNHASVIARENHLKFKRKNGGPVLQLFSNTTERPDKMYVHDGQTFEGSGAD